MAKRNNKKLQSRKTVLTEKIPRGGSRADRVQAELISWNLGLMDQGGDWSWRTVGCDYWWDNIWPKLRDFESMTWNEIVGNINHPIPVKEKRKSAKERLAELQQEDTDNLVSLRLSNKVRIWAIKEGSTLKLLWWDPDHQVYPVKKKHT